MPQPRKHAAAEKPWQRASMCAGCGAAMRHHYENGCWTGCPYPRAYLTDPPRCAYLGCRGDDPDRLYGLCPLHLAMAHL